MLCSYSTVFNNSFIGLGLVCYWYIFNGKIISIYSCYDLFLVCLFFFRVYSELIVFMLIFDISPHGFSCIFRKGVFSVSVDNKYENTFNSNGNPFKNFSLVLAIRLNGFSFQEIQDWVNFPLGFFTNTVV